MTPRQLMFQRATLLKSILPPAEMLDMLLTTNELTDEKIYFHLFILE